MMANMLMVPTDVKNVIDALLFNLEVVGCLMFAKKSVYLRLF